MTNLATDSVPLHAIVIRRFRDGTLDELLAACSTVEAMLADERVADVVDAAMRTLTWRERAVLVQRGFRGGRKRTRPDIGRELNNTASAVRRVELKALQKLKHRTRLGAFIDG